MQENRTRVIVSDLDGTLLRKGAQKLEETAIDLIKKLIDNGYLFIAASGRQYANMQRLFEPIADRITYICENGSLIMHQGVVVQKNTIELDVMKEVLKDMLAIQETSDTEIVVSAVDASLVIPKKPEFDKILREHVNNNVRVIENYLEIEEDVIKFSIYFRNGIPKDKEKEFHDQYDSKLQIVDGGNGWFDFTAWGVNKGAAIMKLSQNLKFHLEEVLCFGDSENDISMLQLAGKSYAMDTANSKIKAVCHKTCEKPETVMSELLRNNENGLE